MRRTFEVLVLAFAVSGCSHHSAPPPSKISWPTQQASIYELKLATTTSMLGAPIPAKLTLVSTVAVTVRDAGAKQQALVVFRDPHFVDAAGQSLAGTEQLAEGLKAPFAVELDHGLISAYFEPPATELGSVGLRRCVATALQFSEHTPKNVWQGKEWDPTGLADVEYRAASEPASGLSWKKLNYEKLVLGQARAPRADVKTELTPKIITSTGKLLLDDRGLATVDRSEELQMPLSATQSLSSAYEIHLHRTALADAAPAADFEKVLASAQRAPVGQPLPSVGSSATDEARAAGRSFPDVLHELEALDAEKQQASAARKGPLFHALVGLFRTQPETIPVALESIRHGSVARDTLLDALAMASSTESIGALDTVTFDATQPEPVRVRAAGSLIRVSHPTPEAMRDVLRMLDVPSLRAHGLLGLGSFVRQLRERGNDDAAAQGTAVLSKQLQAAHTSDERETVLLGIANAGSGELYDAVLKYQDDSTTSVRDAAIQAIRQMPRPEVEPRLVALLDRKSIDDVRSALHALGRRDASKQTTVDRVTQLALHHGDPDIRREAVLVLVHWLEKYPSLAATLAEIRQNDGNERVRDVATPLSAP